ncbi:MAG TPA: rRNA maturation RNase YbeY [Flavobacteriaceae bacterium]|nr:rRNA maturation RNase YbeY [Flavobacteriaceae bacterium]HBR53290.1 rRNA maturation RNase YbeY [Flavobacteriaceae bacterium]|tara:strand:- start:407 stop:823 length:417 start_codon:yes stop_codon:yes gene_type:complete
MIEFYSENNFELDHQVAVAQWIMSIIEANGLELGDITYIFCDDDYLHKLNVQFLQHDTLTDIITFDNSLGSQIHAEIYISTERVTDNAKQFNTSFVDELHRVMIHGILHCCGLKDKSDQEAQAMRTAEDKALEARTFI